MKMGRVMLPKETFASLAARDSDGVSRGATRAGQGLFTFDQFHTADVLYILARAMVWPQRGTSVRTSI